MNTDTQDQIRDQIRELQTLRRRHAATIIAAGLFGSDEQWTDVVSSVAEPKARRTAAAVEALLGTQRVPNPNDASDRDMAAVDLLCLLYTSYLDAGFLVGVAVGMQLGPHAFDEPTTPATTKRGAR